MDPGAPVPAVTVVIIFLDAEPFLSEAIESVLAQTYADYELILVDDGSTDRSTEIAKGYAAGNPGRVLYAEHEGHQNRGMSASRNHGVDMGRGRLISFLDADDIWLPKRLERFVAAIESFPDAGMVYGPTLYWYSWASNHALALEGSQEEDHVGVLDLPTNVVIRPPVALRRFLETNGGCLPGICSLIIRRNAFEAVGGFEPEFRGLYEDQVFLSKITATYPVAVIPDVLDYYRQHAASCCNMSIQTGDYDPSDLHPARGRYLAWLQRYCRERRIGDRGVERALRRQIWPYRSRVGFLFHRARRTLPQAVRRAALRRLSPGVRNFLRAAKASARRLAGSLQRAS